MQPTLPPSREGSEWSDIRDRFFYVSERRHLGTPPHHPPPPAHLSAASNAAALAGRPRWSGDHLARLSASPPPPTQSHTRSIINAQRGVCFHFNNSPQMTFLKAPVKRTPSIIYDQLSVWQMLFFIALCSAPALLGCPPPNTLFLPLQVSFFWNHFYRPACCYLELRSSWRWIGYGSVARSPAWSRKSLLSQCLCVFILTARLKWLWQRWAAVALYGWRASHPGEMQLEYFSMVIVKDLYA